MLLAELREAGLERDELEMVMRLAGQGAPLIRRSPAPALVAELVAEAESALGSPRPSASNSISGPGAWRRSIASSRTSSRVPPGAEKPPSPPSAATTRWQGTTIGNRFRPSAWPTSRASRGAPIRPRSRRR